MIKTGVFVDGKRGWCYAESLPRTDKTIFTLELQAELLVSRAVRNVITNKIRVF